MTSNTGIPFIRRRAAATAAAPAATSQTELSSDVSQKISSPTLGSPSKKSETAPKVVPGIGEEGCRLRSPSGVNMLPEWQQAIIFIAIMVALGIGTAIYSWVLTTLSANFAWFRALRYSWPITLGLFYVFVGITHFTTPNDYENMYPYQGAWGIWYLPGSKTFHVVWTGIAEVTGGVGLVVGGVLDLVDPVYLSSLRIVSDAGMVSDCALILYVLTWAVTPANIYMFSHGAKVSNYKGDIPMHLHLFRFVMQVHLLGLLWQLTDVSGGSNKAFSF